MNRKRKWLENFLSCKRLKRWVIDCIRFILWWFYSLDYEDDIVVGVLEVYWVECSVLIILNEYFYVCILYINNSLDSC